ncbi:MAG: FxLD family lanthipeptide [Pseudonocardiaceae bacterium]
MAQGSTSAMALVDDIAGAGGFEGEFDLDLRVIEAAYPMTKLLCDTSDGCGSTCSGSACNSTANNPS